MTVEEEITTRASDIVPGQCITIRAIVMNQDARHGQTQMYIDGIGDSGHWSLVHSAEVTPAPMDWAMMRRAVEASEALAHQKMAKARWQRGNTDEFRALVAKHDRENGFNGQ